MFFLFLKRLKMIPAYKRSTLTNSLQIDHIVFTRGQQWGKEMRFRAVTRQVLILYLILQEHTVVHVCILDCIRNDWNSDENQSVVCFFNCYVVHFEEKPFGKYLWMFWGRMQSQSIMQKEVQALCYLKFLYNSKQCDLFRGSCFGYYVDFSGDGSQSDLYHVEWLYDFSSIVSHLGRTLDPTLLL